MINANLTFKDSRIILKDIKYEKCIFENCTIEYLGSSNFSLVDCSFQDCQWIFTNESSNTIQFLKILYHNLEGDGKKMVDQIFDDIKKG